MKRNMAEKVRAKIIGIMAAVLMMILITGCSAGSTIDATLSINSDLSGTRKMNITISNDVFNQYFNGTIEDLNALITSSCPDAITWTYSDDGNTRQYNMEIAFSSPEDYKQKVTSILGEEPAELTIQAPDTVWANGIYIEESFTDEDLLRWMKDLMVNNGYVSSDNANMIFSTGTVEVVYQDETYRTNSRISVNQVDYVSIDTINILTDVNGLDNFNREVQIVIPQNAMDKRGDDIKAYLDNVVPSGASSEWGVNDFGATLFSVKAGNMNAGQLEKFNCAVFGSDACVVTTTDVSEYYSPFSFDQYITEELDLTQYLVGDYSSIYCTYQTKCPNEYGVYSSNDGTSFWESGWYSSDSTEYLTINDANYRGDILHFSMLVQKSFDVASADITTSRKMFGSTWKQTISFLMKQVPSEEEANTIISILQGRLGEQEEVSISGEETDDGYQINIKREGTLEEINASSEPLFGRAGTLNYAKDKDFSKVKKQEAFEERLYLGELLTNRTEDFAITYTLNLGMLTDSLYCSNDSAQISGGKISASFHDPNVYMQYVGTRIDLFALLFWVFLVVGCASTLLLLIKLGIFKAKPKQPQAAQPATNTQDTVTTTSSEPVKIIPKFCEKCGAPREQTDSFCEKCGTKFEI